MGPGVWVLGWGEYQTPSCARGRGVGSTIHLNLASSSTGATALAARVRDYLRGKRRELGDVREELVAAAATVAPSVQRLRKRGGSSGSASGPRSLVR